MGAIIKNISKNVVTAVIFRIFLVLLLLSCVIITTTKLMEYNDLQKEKTAFEIKKKELIERNEELGYDLAADPNSEEYIEKHNPNKVKPNEELIIGEKIRLFVNSWGKEKR